MRLEKLLAVLLIALASMTVGCGEVVEPGETILMLHSDGSSDVVDQGRYNAWGYTKVYKVDQRLKSYSEEGLSILCKDKLNMKVDAKIVMNFKVDEKNLDFIRKRIPVVTDDAGQKRLSLDELYKLSLSDVFVKSVKDEIAPNNTEEIGEVRKELNARIQKTVVERIEELGYPVHVSAVLITNLDFPQEIDMKWKRIKEAELSDEQKAAEAEAELAEEKRRVAIEQEKAKTRMVKAQAQADENKILTESLTPEFLMWRQLEVLENTADKVANGPNNTVFMMPFEMMRSPKVDTALIREAVEKK